MTKNETQLPPQNTNVHLKDEAVYTAEERAKDRIRIVVLLVLAAYSMSALAAVVYLTFHEIKVPESLILTLSLSLGAVAGMAASK